MAYTRPQSETLGRRLAEPRRFLMAVVGPRQVGKTTLVQQVTEASGLATRFASADEPTLRGASWIEQQWEGARLTAEDAGRRGAVLVLDEIQKLTGWSDSVKRLWDEDTRSRRRLKVILLGSAPLLRNHSRWARYILDSLIETTISRDVLLLSRVDKPALLRRLFQLGC